MMLRHHHHWLSNLLLVALGGGLSSVANGQVTYGPLNCNANLDCSSTDATSTPLSTLVNAAGGLSRVIVPCGQCAHVDYISGETITMPHGLEVVGRLLFPPSSNVALNTTSVIVQGNLDIEPPLEGNEVKIIMHGTEEQYLYPYDGCNGGYDPTCPAKVGVGKKPIVVAGGKLDIRGIEGEITTTANLFTNGASAACPSWTRLDRKVSDTTLKVDPAFASCVAPGDTLLVTTDNTNFSDDMKRIVSSVDSDTGDINLAVPITRALPGLTGPGEPDFAVEVARLNRRVVFTAVEETSEHYIGGHFMVFATPDVEQVISGVHFDNFGQGGNIGRYPIHFHLCNNSNGSIVSKNVITNSNQRCVLIHGTNGVTVEDNVAWSTRGHCYATETGSEINNIFKNNLGSRTMFLWKHNGQSDSHQFWTGKHMAATFWVRNMNNEWSGNVAAGSESLGWWLEMVNQYGDQQTLGPVSSFRDNVAHSNRQIGFNTYKKGWTPTNGGVIDNLRIYKNPETGFKFHITGNVKITNSLFADNKLHVLSGVWNGRVTFENTVIDALSQDAQLRQGWNCPIGGGTAIKHAYNTDIDGKTLTLTNVTFANFKQSCGNTMFSLYSDSRMSGRAMGVPVQASGISLVNVGESKKPYFGCDHAARNTFLEDVDGVLGPSGSNSGFIVRNTPWMLKFIPPEACSIIPYAGNDCSVFCEGTCLRQVIIKPWFNGQTRANIQLLLSDGITEKTYSNGQFADFRDVLPQGSYHGRFFDETGEELIASAVDITPGQKPLCDDFVTSNDFVFSTNEPTLSPSSGPTTTYSPTLPPGSVVRVKSAVNGRFLWVRSNGGLKLSSDMTLENTAIILKKVGCLNEGYHFAKGLTTPCYLINWENGRHLEAKSGQRWTNGIYTTDSVTIRNENYWYFDPINCGVTGLPATSCTLLRNALNGRALYDNFQNGVFGASPDGDPGSYIFDNASYRWNLIDVNSGIALNVNGLA